METNGMDALRLFITSIQSRDAYRRPVIPLLIVFSAGLWCGERIFLPRPLSGVIIGLCLAGTMLSIIRKQASTIIPLLLFFFLGWFCMTGFIFPDLPENHVVHLAGQTQWTITGTITDEPVSGADRRRFYLKPRRLDNGRQCIRAIGNLRVTVYGFDGPKLSCGDVVRFQSRIRKIDNFRNPGCFDYKRYLAFQKVFGLTYAEADEVEVLSGERYSGLWPAIEAIRGKIAGQIEKSGHGGHIGILKALVIGRENDVDPALREAFSRAGVAHLLAISGMQVAIVAGLAFFILVRLLAFIPALTWQGWVRKFAALGALPCVVAYGLLAGMSPSTQRAMVMAMIFLAAMLAGRRHQLMNTLALAALVILAVNPPYIYSISFQLSFASVFFIVTGMSAAENQLNRLENKWLRRSAAFVLVSFFAIAGTTPLTAYYFNEVSWVGLLANCIMIPLVELVSVPVGLCGAALFGISQGASLLFFKVAGLILSLGCVLTETIAALPGAAFKTVTPNVFEIGCYYALFWALTVIVKQGLSPFIHYQGQPSSAGSPMAKAAIIIALLSVAGLAIDIGWWINHRRLHEDLRITALDVGQGNAALLELPGGRCLLIDGGGFTGSSTFDVGKMIVAPFLWHRKIGAVDTLILTHPDTDHLAGLIYIAEHFHVKTVWFNNEPVNTENYRKFMEVIKNKKITMPGFSGLEKTRLIDGVRFEILYPPDDFMNSKKIQTWRNTNNNSLVTRVSLGKISFLFPGDLMEEGERDLTIRSGKRLASTVLMAPHHGSRTSSTAFFLSMVKPEIVVVSAGRQNRFGCPWPAVLNRYAAIGADVFRTDLHGAVVMSTTETGLTVNTPAMKKPGFIRSSLFRIR